MFLRGFALGAVSVSSVALVLTRPSAVSAESIESPAPIVSTATPRPLGLHVGTSASFTLINQNTAGGGQIAPEAPGFISGAPLSPNTPYDLFSSAPQTPGVAGIGQIVSTLDYSLRMFDIGLTSGLGYVRGSTTNAAYWGENLLPTLNVHSGSQALPYRIAFPTHPGLDDATAMRLSLLGASFATADGNLRVRGGWFDLTQTDRFVFAQPALTSLNPQIAYMPAESLSSGPANATFWQPGASALPLQGLNVVARRGNATLELTNAALPSLPGESARMTMGSLAMDRGGGTRFSAQLLHVTTSGLAFGTTVPFGLDPQFMPTPQGILPVSTLNGQRQTIAGLRSAFHVAPASNIDGVIEIGRAWYDASPVARPGSQAPGGFYHVGFAKMQNRVTASLDLYRMEPRYASIILPYGVSENQWSAAFAWPGQWLKSNYQLIDNSVLGVNRQGYRVRYYVDNGPFEVHLEHTDVRQIEPETMQTSTQSGFIDGYYLPQFADSITLGRQKRDVAWLAWHPSFGDLTLDIVDDTLFRPFRAAHPEDAVSYEVPQAVLTYAKHVAKGVYASAGLGRYAMKGAFAQPIDFAERLFFIGAQIQQTPKTALLITFRRTSFQGLSTDPAAGNSPNFTGSAIIIEQRIQF
ncbi:MAG: hypothetical protein NVS3B28_18650 [Candidatus Velthaea sp.]